MRKIEQQIIDTLTNGVFAGTLGAFKTLVKEFVEAPLGQTTEAFLNHELLKKYLAGGKKISEKFTAEIMAGLKLRLLIDYYLTQTDKKEKEECFSKIKVRIKEIKETISKPDGQGLLPSDINRGLIRSIYLSQFDALIKLFSESLPIPSMEVFEGYPIPDFIKNRQAETTEAVLKFLGDRSLSSVEPSIMKLQRSFRSKRRQKEERARIFEYESIAGKKEGEKKKRVEEVLAEANTPYKPRKCSAALADRIVEAAKEITLFTTVHHYTSESALANILDNCLYGRRTLLQKYLSFKPAALGSVDLELGGGDANAICFGPKLIDPKAIQTDAVDLTFNLASLGKENPCIFYKQRDLGYDPGTVRSLDYGRYSALTFSFSHTKPLPSGGKEGCTNLQIFNTKGKAISAYSELPNYHFTAYDIPKMHQILTLNFFRFLDTLCDQNGLPDEPRIQAIYQEIGSLNKKALVEYLTSLAGQMIDTSEFNFYGAYKIDFSAIQTIEVKKANYKLNLPAFVKALQEGDSVKLKEVREKIPNIFKSYRFLDYLISKIDNEGIKKEMVELRMGLVSTQPLWMNKLQENRKKAGAIDSEQRLLVKFKNQ